MSREISVSKYPGDNGVLYRTPQGIIYKATGEGIIALGHDVNDTGIISPFDSVNMKALVHGEFTIDDSLAREYRSTGGLSARCFTSVNGIVTYVPPNPLLIPVIPTKIYQPISLVKRVFDYIVKNPDWVRFDFQKLPLKMKNHIDFCLKLKDKQDELSLAKRNYTTSIGSLETSYRAKEREIQDAHQRRLLTLNDFFSMKTEKLRSNHSRAVKELTEASTDEDTKIVTEISKLEFSISKYSWD